MDPSHLKLLIGLDPQGLPLNSHHQFQELPKFVSGQIETISNYLFEHLENRNFIDITQYIYYYYRYMGHRYNVNTPFTQIVGIQKPQHCLVNCLQVQLYFETIFKNSPQRGLIDLNKLIFSSSFILCGLPIMKSCSSSNSDISPPPF